MKDDNVYVIRLNREWVEFRAGSKKPTKVITYFTNKKIAKAIKLPNFRLRNVSHEGGRCLGANRFGKFEAFCQVHGLTIPKVDETLKIPPKLAGLFLDRAWRKRHGI